MVLYNAGTKELTAKIVYYGPGLGGKTTNLQLLHDRLDPDSVGKLLSLSTQTDRTIYFDMLPVELGEIKGYKIRFQLATVPGQTAFNETRKVVLRGADGIVFVADSRWAMLPKNQESWQNMKDNLREVGFALDALPIVVQYNKRDLSDILSVEAMQESLGLSSYPFAEAVASAGRGVTETFKLISKLTFVDLLRRLQGRKPDETAAESPVPALLHASPPEGVAEPAPGINPSGPSAAGPDRVAAAEARLAAIEESLANKMQEHQPPVESGMETADRLAAAEARLAAVEERLASATQEHQPPVESGAETAERLAAAEARVAASEERFASEAKERQRLAESGEEAAGRIGAAEARIAAFEERLAADAEEHRLLKESGAETAERLAAGEKRIEEFEASRRTAQQAAEAAVASLSAWTGEISEEIAGLARRVEALESGFQEKTERGLREAEDIRSRIAPLLEAHAAKGDSDRQALSELDRLRESLADSLADISDRVRRAVQK